LKQKEKVLSELAKCLNENNVKWALGGSMMLYFRKITSHANDLDIMINVEQKEVVKDLFLNLGKMHESQESTVFQSQVFLEFDIDGVEIDVIGGFVINVDGNAQCYPLENKEYDQITVDNETVFLDDISAWYTYYKAMNKDIRVQEINTYLSKKEL
jgi:hypothetical protein